MERLVSAVADRGGRVILAGDSRQLPSIAAGGALAGLAERLGAAELTGNRRQGDELQRKVARLLSEGEAGSAIALLTEHGRLQAYRDGRAARAALIECWREDCLHEPEHGLILAHERHEVAALNALARAERETAGLLSRERLFAGGREWAVGDRLNCRRNDYRLGVRNRTRGSVVAVDVGGGGLTLRTDEGRTVSLPAGYLKHAEYGYAATGHVSQGETVDHTYLLASARRGGREWAYVAGSRHRVDLRVFAVHHEGERLQKALAAAWSRSQAARLAVDLVSPERREAAVAEAGAQAVGELPKRLGERPAELRRDPRRASVPGAYHDHAARSVRMPRSRAERGVLPTDLQGTHPGRDGARSWGHGRDLGIGP
jgi:ATP-dependent exoDNAse (exonuclease V) alpha subunit